eukprot:8596397-Alexandrium_andersonii.AAC.1
MLHQALAPAQARRLGWPCARQPPPRAQPRAARPCERPRCWRWPPVELLPAAERCGEPLAAL